MRMSDASHDPGPRFGNLIIVTREMSKCCFDISMDGWMIGLSDLSSSLQLPFAAYLSHPRNFHRLTIEDRGWA